MTSRLPSFEMTPLKATGVSVGFILILSILSLIFGVMGNSVHVSNSNYKLIVDNAAAYAAYASQTQNPMHKLIHACMGEAIATNLAQLLKTDPNVRAIANECTALKTQAMKQITLKCPQVHVPIPSAVVAGYS